MSQSRYCDPTILIGTIAAVNSVFRLPVYPIGAVPMTIYTAVAMPTHFPSFRELRRWKLEV